MNNNTYLHRLNISPETAEFIAKTEKRLAKEFFSIDQVASINQCKVLDAFHACGVSARHFIGSTGYGYGDDGRDTLDRLFARVFGCEDALVRPQFVSGTHALSVCLFGLLRPGDALLSATGKPYDTLIKAIGWDEPCGGSLKEMGVGYKEVPLKEDGSIDVGGVVDALTESVRVVLLQRSRGYAWRPSFFIWQLKETIDAIKQKRGDVIVMVDNCYGEFVETTEPSEAGADIVVGSLIKNAGGGLAPTGGYIAGGRECIKRVAVRLTSPGIGREVGCNPSGYLPYYQGLFLAPHVVAQSLKTAVLFAAAFESLGFDVLPKSKEPRTDIIQAVQLGSAQALIAFCQAIQQAAPVDAHALPEPWDMPGYSDPVIMAAGTFIQGASIELSADAPIRAPYTVYFQGGLTYEHGRIGAMMAIEKLRKLELVRQ
ncbi:MAG: aminotransferase class I/II-fold pyridoxal phosphate-dependent enzyme [Bacillota bacterium]